MYIHCSACTLVHSKDTKSWQSRDTGDETPLVAAFKGLKVFVSVATECLEFTGCFFVCMYLAEH